MIFVHFSVLPYWGKVAPVVVALLNNLTLFSKESVVVISTHPIYDFIAILDSEEVVLKALSEHLIRVIRYGIWIVVPFCVTIKEESTIFSPHVPSKLAGMNFLNITSCYSIRQFDFSKTFLLRLSWVAMVISVHAKPINRTISCDECHVVTLCIYTYRTECRSFHHEIKFIESLEILLVLATPRSETSDPLDELRLAREFNSHFLASLAYKLRRWVGLEGTFINQHHSTIIGGHFEEFICLMWSNFHNPVLFLSR